ncbi:NB-ARC domain-containing protein [Streptomyces sp. NPDC015130]|uniref:NB-ARC domain-containing protein n=1 Tax=Streptomyces sp. NPDC015130 TaxID=3364940 RepID=UPI0036F7CAB6
MGTLNRIGGNMNPALLAATSASIVGALTTEAWPQLRDRMTKLFLGMRRPQEAAQVTEELDEAREMILAVEIDEGRHIEHEATVVLQRRLRDLLYQDASANEDLQEILVDLLVSPSTNYDAPDPRSLALLQLVDDSTPAPGEPRRAKRTLSRRQSSLRTALQDITIEFPLATARMLPQDPPSFTGRDRELHQLLEVGTRTGESPVVLLHGMPGVGKTALAVHVAHALADEFPDGQLFINLRGHAPADVPASPKQLLGSLLVAVGIPAPVQPPSVHGRAGLWRSWLATRNVLLILDDAADFAQVQHLLPGYPGCLTLITSRVRLEVPEISLSLPLDVLRPEESAALFHQMLHQRGASTGPSQAAEVARLCGHLPLALSMVSGLLMAHPTWTVNDLVDDLDHFSRRLIAPNVGATSVGQALGTSLRSLEPGQQTFLRRLSLHPGPDLEKRACSVLTGVTVDRADEYLENLYQRSLLSEVSPGRFRMHDLLVSYLESAPERDDSDPETDLEREGHLQRLVDYYQRTATAAYLMESHLQPVEELRTFLPDSAPPLNDAAQAADWLAAELDNLAACTQFDADHPDAVAQISTIVTAHLLRLGASAVDTAEHVIGVGRHRAFERGDLRAAALFTHLSGIIALARGELSQARDTLDEARALSARGRWQLGEARALFTLFIVCRISGAPDASRDTLNQAGQLFAEAGDQRSLARVAEQINRLESDKAGQDLAQLTGPSGQPQAALPLEDILEQLEQLALAMYLESLAATGQTATADDAQRLPAAEQTDEKTPAEQTTPPDDETPETDAGNYGGIGGEPPDTPVPAEFPDEDPDPCPTGDISADAESSIPVEDLDAIDEQVINFWFTDDIPDDQPLKVDTSYTGCFQVGPDRDENRAEGDRAIPPDDIPADGLPTQWYVLSRTCKLALADETREAEPSTAGEHPEWAVEFDLLVLPHAPSEERLVTVTPTSPGTCRIDVLVMVDGDLYRELTIEFPAEPATPGSTPPTQGTPATGAAPTRELANLPAPRDEKTPPALPPSEPGNASARAASASRRPPNQRPGARVSIRSTRRVAAKHTALQNPHDWQQPAHTLTLTLMPPRAVWQLDVEGKPGQKTSGFENWQPEGDAAQWASEVQEALEAYRQHHASRYNSITPKDIANRLHEFTPDADWANSGTRATPDDQQAWSEVEHSPHLRELAMAGSQLFTTLFPREHRFHQLIKNLAPGDRLHVNWRDDSLDHIPWPLMYGGTLPSAGQPVSAQEFFGLRLRTTHIARSAETARVLSPDFARAHLMYWGGSEGDETTRVALEHINELDQWKPLVLPQGQERRKEELSTYLCNPDSLSLLYVFSQAYSRKGQLRGLRFGSTVEDEDVLLLSEMGDQPLSDQPLVFMNACETSSAEYLHSNLLQNHFVRRGSRAYIGSECKVPAGFAARFAHVFFHFLYDRSHRNHPTAAGEALAQTRKFFWDQYRSIGGLFYSYVNDDQLFVARPGEVEAMHNPRRATPQTTARYA